MSSNSIDTYLVTSRGEPGHDPVETVVQAEALFVEDGVLYAHRDGKKIAGYRDWTSYGRQMAVS